MAAKLPDWAGGGGGVALSRTQGQAQLLRAWSPQRTDDSLFC